MNLADHIRENYTLAKPCWDDPSPDNPHSVWLKIGSQSFCITQYPCDNLEEAGWYRTQLANALANMVDALPPWLLPKDKSLSDAGGKG